MEVASKIQNHKINEKFHITHCFVLHLQQYSPQFSTRKLPVNQTQTLRMERTIKLGKKNTKESLFAEFITKGVLNECGSSGRRWPKGILK